ncbi:hypothetical protein L873DRAFT_1840982 [Choiromyces venosus 120613-1]|uniref:Uncharacterized protein n=1 Tax=Choiromyces venosus 120613-1 TaxID=1336337 RepID=A0A3N4KCW0_9PEZI|nr:hypothetical protein L873DRAFT_1840982 [Choiromyces venosus 120613-1]
MMRVFGTPVNSALRLRLRVFVQRPSAVPWRAPSKRFRSTVVGRGPVHNHLWDHIQILDNRVAQSAKELGDLKVDVQRLAGELKADMGELKGDMGELKGDMHKSIRELTISMEKGFGAINSRFRELELGVAGTRWRVHLLFGGVAGVAGVVGWLGANAEALWGLMAG